MGIFRCNTLEYYKIQFTIKMSKLVFLVVCIVTSLCADAQQGAICKIVDFSPGVTIDGTTPFIAQDILASVKEIRIPRKGYCTIIAADGFFVRLTKTISLASIAQENGSRTVPRKSVTRSNGDIHLFFGGSSCLKGDTILLMWYPDSHDGSYKVTFKNLMDESLFHLTTSNRWIKMHKNQIPQSSDAFVVGVERDEKERNYPQIVAIKPTCKSGDVSFSKVEHLQLPSIDKDVFRLALLETHNFMIDLHLELIDYFVSKQTPEDPLLKAYLLNSYLVHDVSQFPIFVKTLNEKK